MCCSSPQVWYKTQYQDLSEYLSSVQLDANANLYMIDQESKQWQSEMGTAKVACVSVP